ncbi:MAG: hypothetical protein NWE79_02335 [Candidatus Bathyarchaeota archaeon]|jgi:hypothetical protein|nr:hypothetical protein [Candidatus Bathyarchaeota archaeon]
MNVTVQVALDVAKTLNNRGTPSTKSLELLRIVDRLGVSLKPIHPGTDDPLLSQFFLVEVPDEATAENVIAGLKKSKAIQAAYLKPPDEMPL